jgi:hypothetical protein
MDSSVTIVPVDRCNRHRLVRLFAECRHDRVLIEGVLEDWDAEVGTIRERSHDTRSASSSSPAASAVITATTSVSGASIS